MKTRMFSGWTKSGILVPSTAVLIWALAQAATAGTCVPVPAGAVAWWRAETNTLDSISINDATFVEGSLYVPGKVGLAFYTWDGFLTTSMSEELDVGAGAGFTVEGRIYPRAVTQMNPILGWLDGRGMPGVALVLNNPSGSGPVLEAYLSETNSQPASVTVLRGAHAGITNEIWQHVALTFDKATGVAAIIYNGLPLAQTNLGSFRPQTRLPVQLGLAGIEIGSSQFFGRLDEFTIYNRALAVAEIQAIVAADSAGKRPSPLECAPPPSDFVAWWRGESNTLDHVDGNQGVIAQSLLFRNGRVGNCFQFDQGYVRVPASSNLDVGVGSGLTVEAWMKPDWAYHVIQPLIEWNSGTGAQGVSLTHFGFQALAANLMDTSGIAHWMRSPERILTLSNWQHVALTYDKASGRAALYLNGLSLVKTNLGYFTPQTSTDLYLGYHPNPSGAFIANFRGALDEVSLYARALGADEIRAIVMARSLGKCKAPPGIVTQPPNLRVNAGADAQFAILTIGNPRLRFQWFKDGVLLAGATDSSLTLTNIQNADAGSYRVCVTNWFGTVTSSNAVLQVNHPPVTETVLAPLSHLPGVTNLLVIAPVGTNATVYLDGSRSTDVENDPLQYFWSEGTNTFATGVLATNQFAPGLHIITLIVSDGQAAGTNSVVLEVLSPEQAIGTLTELVESSDLSGKNANPLLASLQSAAASFARGNTTAGLNELQAFQNKVRAQITPLDPVLATALIEAAQEIIDALSAPVTAPRATANRLADPTQFTSGKFQMCFNGPHGRAYFIETSTDLTTWKVIGVAHGLGENRFDFEDVRAAQFPVRFYRVAVP